MSEIIVYFRGTPEELKARLALLPAAMRGEVPIVAAEAEKERLNVGFEALKMILENFTHKSMGGGGEDGRPWQKLSPNTLAYKKANRPVKAKKVGKRLGTSRPTLAPEQDMLWKKIFKRVLRDKKKEAGKDESTKSLAKEAAATAWHILKTVGAQTLKKLYGEGGYETRMGFETGRLMSSLTMTSPTPMRNDTILDPSGGIVEVGTGVEYAKFFNKGGKNQPAREFIPEVMPDLWKVKIQNKINDSFQYILILLLTK